MKVLEVLEKIEEKLKTGVYQREIKRRTEEDGKEPYRMMLDEFDIEPIELEGYYIPSWRFPVPIKTKMTFKKVEVLFENKTYIIQIVSYKPPNMIKIGWEKAPLFGWEFYEFKQFLKKKLEEIENEGKRP